MTTVLILVGFAVGFYVSWRIGAAGGYRDGYIQGAVDAAVALAEQEDEGEAAYLEEFGGRIDAGKRGEN